MKKIRIIILICMLAFGIALCGMAIADGPTGPHRGDGPMFLSRLIRHNMVVQVLSQLSGQSADTITQQLKAQDLSGMLGTYKIDPQAFHSAMSSKLSALITLLTDNGYITTDQSIYVENRMANSAQRRQLLTTLVQKVIEDGAVTQDQAQILLPQSQ